MEVEACIFVGLKLQPEDWIVDIGEEEATKKGA